jgi:tyrosine-protein kinase Etk/Wzc
LENNEQNKNFDFEEEEKMSNPLKEFNVGLFIHVLNKSVLWIILFVAICLISSLVYLRYTPRIYESSSTLLFNSEKKNELLGIEKIAVEQDNAAINREIQLLKSPLC